VIIVEGLDNTGKTTLVSKIIREFPQLVYRPSIGNKHDLELIREAAMAEAFEWDRLRYTVGDRSRLMSEFIYNPILQTRGLAYPLHHFLEMLGSFVQENNLVIICYRNRLAIENSFSEREQLKGVRQHLPELSHQYDRLGTMLEFLNVAAEGKTKVMNWSFDKHSEVVVYNEIRRYLHLVKEVDFERK